VVLLPLLLLLLLLLLLHHDILKNLAYCRFLKGTHSAVVPEASLIQVLKG